MHTMYQYEDLKLVRLSEVNRSKQIRTSVSG